MKTNRFLIFGSMVVLVTALLFACGNPLASTPGETASLSASQGTVSLRIAPIAPVVLDTLSKLADPAASPSLSALAPTSRAYLYAKRVHIVLSGDLGQVEWYEDVDADVVNRTQAAYPYFYTTERVVNAGDYTVWVGIDGIDAAAGPTVSGAGSLTVLAGQTNSMSIVCTPMNAEELQFGVAAGPFELATPWVVGAETTTPGSEQWFAVDIPGTNPKRITLSPVDGSNAMLVGYLYDSDGSYVTTFGAETPGMEVVYDNFWPSTSGTYYLGVIRGEYEGTPAEGQYTVLVDDSPLGDSLLTSWETDNASSTFGYRADGASLGAGQSVTYPGDYEPTTFSVMLNGAFTSTDDGSSGYPVRLWLYIWDASEGAYFGSSSVDLPDSFSGGWVTFDLYGRGISIPVNTPALYAVYLDNAQENHLTNSIAADQNDGYEGFGANDTRWTAEESAISDLSNFAYWSSGSWDLDFRLEGIFAPPPAVE